MSYQPLNISGNTTGLVQNREEFILPNDAYPTLENAYVWRERIKRKQGYELLGRLQRNFSLIPRANTVLNQTFISFNVFNFLAIVEPNAQLVPGSFSLTVGAPDTSSFTDNGLGGFTTTGKGLSAGSSINYETGAVLLLFNVALTGGAAVTFSVGYYPGLPVMGIRQKENQSAVNDTTVFWDTKYAYVYNGGTMQFEEFLPGTVWTGTDSEFFWTTNYWVGTNNFKIFWATNFSVSGDPIRYTNGVAGTNWVNFTPQVNASGTVLAQALALLPFRGRLVAFNTRETGGTTPGAYSNRIRWASIGNPFTVTDPTNIPPIQTITPGAPSFQENAWRDDVRGKGGFLDIPTNEDIVCVGFVRDNLVIYCERSTWQLRYTGRTIAPFQIEKVNSELGALSTFSAIQFDTSLLGIGDRGIVECDSFKSERIDIKIPDLVNTFQNLNNGPARIHGIRDFENRLAFWIFNSASNAETIYPDMRLVYNYENDSWALFTDSLTALGFFQTPNSRTWINTPLPWIHCNFPWISQALLEPVILGGNQQGFIEELDELTTNDPSLFISAITAQPTPGNPTEITSPNHNMSTDFVIEITGIPTGTPFDNLNGGIFGINVLTPNTFQLFTYNTTTQDFTDPQVDATGQTYIGGGLISVRDNFSVISKKFNFMDQGESIQLGFLDILLQGDESDTNSDGQISMNVYLDYNESQASNILDMNEDSNGNPDTFFNSIIPTTQSVLNQKGGTKFWQRVFCATRGNFITIEYTFNNSQMAGIQQELDVQIDSQILHIRPAGRLTQI